MEKIKVLISWSGDNYCADSADENINGAVLASNSTFDGVKKEFESALKFHVEGCLFDGDILPEWLKIGDYEFEYILETSALLHRLDGILTRSAIARVTGINERQLGHYASGLRKPRPDKRKQIINGIHQISRELALVV